MSGRIGIPDPGTAYRRRGDLRQFIDRRGALVIFDRDPGLWLRIPSPAGQVIWRALAQPVTADELCRRLCSLYPQVGRARIEEDVHAFLRRLTEVALLLDGGKDGMSASPVGPEPQKEVRSAPRFP